MVTLSKTYLCPVCGFDRLREPPRTATGGGSFEICPSCGFEFGVSDDDGGYTYSTWREEWVKRGMPWSSVAPVPPTWNPSLQIKNVTDDND